MRELQVVPTLSQLACRRLGETGGTWTNSGDCHYAKASRKNREIFYKYEYYHLSFKLKARKWLLPSLTRPSGRSPFPHMCRLSPTVTHTHPLPHSVPCPVMESVTWSAAHSPTFPHVVTHLWMTQSHAPQGPESCGLGLFSHASLTLTLTLMHVHTLSSERVRLSAAEV